MPQLFSRVDEMNWLTPSIAELLDQGAAAPGGDGAIREQIKILQDDLAALETPVRVVNVRPTPSYNLFVVQLDQGGRRGKNRSASLAELRRAIGQVAEKHKDDWRLGFMAQLEEAPDVSGIFLRAEQHRPLSLRRLLIQTPFRVHPSTTAFTLGVTLEQKLIVRDLDETGHLLVVGEGTARHHAVASLLLTLMLLNTPAEVRIALNGQGSDSYKPLADAPHSLGQRAASGSEILAFMEGVAAEAHRRLDRIFEEGGSDLKAYNARLREKNEAPLPRMVVVMDSLSDPELPPTLIPHLRDLLINGAQAGIHLVLTIQRREALPVELQDQPLRALILRGAAPELGDQVKNFHSSLLRFVDAFVVEGGDVIPVELAAISNNEMRSAVNYWQTEAAKRRQEVQAETISARTGVTGILSPTMLPNALLDVPAQPAEVMRPAYQARQQAQMLAAYLGWLSAGALQDILAMTETEALNMLDVLRAEGILEDAESPAPRFVRLAENPVKRA